MTRNTMYLTILVALCLSSSLRTQIDALSPIELLEESFEAIPNFAENFIAKPLVIEKEGIDDDGNEFYEKDIIMGSGFPAAGLPLPLPPRPVLAQQRLMDALRSEERNILNANVRLMESQLPRVLGMMNAAAAGAGRDRLFTSSNNIFSNFLPQIQMGRQHIARLPFDDEGQIEEIGWAKPTLRIKPAFGMIVSSKSSAENQRQPLVEPASLNRLEENLNNADTEFINNLHHVQDAETRQASDRKMLIDEIGQFFDEYDQTAKLGPSPKSSATAEQQMDKKSLESDMAADMNVFDVVDASYIFIEVDKNVNKHDVELLLKAVSNITQIPTEYIDDINISKGLVFFKISKPNVNTSKYVNIITNSIDKIQHSTGLKIVSCGLGNRENYVEVAKQKYIDSNSENFLLVTIIICATVACVLLSLLVIFLIRRRAHLRNKLAGDVSISGGGGKGNFNDEERLITDDNKGRSFSFWPFNKLRKSDNLKGELASPSQNYQDLCRSRMQGKATPQGPGSSSLNDSTPSIVPNSANRVQSVGSDGKTESSRSSTSSW